MASSHRAWNSPEWSISTANAGLALLGEAIRGAQLEATGGG